MPTAECPAKPERGNVSTTVNIEHIDVELTQRNVVCEGYESSIRMRMFQDNALLDTENYIRIGSRVVQQWQSTIIFEKIYLLQMLRLMPRLTELIEREEREGSYSYRSAYEYA